MNIRRFIIFIILFSFVILVIPVGCEKLYYTNDYQTKTEKYILFFKISEEYNSTFYTKLNQKFTNSIIDKSNQQWLIGKTNIFGILWNWRGISVVEKLLYYCNELEFLYENLKSDKEKEELFHRFRENLIDKNLAGMQMLFYN